MGGMIRRGVGLVCVLVLPFLCAATPGGVSNPETPATCGGIPEDEPLIGGLATGQVLHGDGTTTLRFANRVYGCNEWPNSLGGASCETTWIFRLTLPLSELAVGVYDLAELGADYGSLMSAPTGAQRGGGCSDQWCPSALTGNGTATANDGAVLEIYSVDGDCVTGKLSDFSPQITLPQPDVNGAFFALPCSE
jgi:hypothetical protein